MYRDYTLPDEEEVPDFLEGEEYDVISAENEELLEQLNNNANDTVEEIM